MKTVTRFMCDVCEGGYEDRLSAEECETKHKVNRQILYLADWEFAQREPNTIHVFTFSSFEEMNLFGYGQKNRIFSGPGKYVYVNSTGSFISLETFLAQKREELNEFIKLAENQLNELTLLLKNNENY